MEWCRSCQEETLWLMKPFPNYFLFNLGISFTLLASCFGLNDLKCAFEIIIAQHSDVLWYHIESKKISTKVFLSLRIFYLKDLNQVVWKHFRNKNIIYQEVQTFFSWLQISNTFRPSAFLGRYFGYY